MGLTGADLARLGPAAQKQVLDKLGMMGKHGHGDPGGNQRSVSAGERTLRGRKYHNEPDSRGNLHFDSKKEARRYDELLVLLRAGKIRNLRLQAQYTLQESYITPEGERVRAIRYVADFAYERPAMQDSGTVYWLPVVEDVKSRATRTAQYEMKKKLLRERFNITITEV